MAAVCQKAEGKGVFGCCTAAVKREAIKKEHCWVNNAIMSANRTPLAGLLLAIPGLEFCQCIHAVNPGKSKVVNYIVQQPKKDSHRQRNLKQHNSFQCRGEHVKGDRTEVRNIKNNFGKTG